MHKKIAVVTGASSGMGREFVKCIEQYGSFDEIWVIARRLDRLEALKNDVKCALRAFSFDLTDADALRQYSALLEAESPQVTLLINCSGFGKFGHHDKIPVAECMNMIDLNCKALVYVTEETLKYMPDGSRIIELDSLSAFQPVPYINVYAATKAFVLSYTQGLNAELSSRNIHMLAVCPGWVKTEFFNRAESNGEKVVTYFNKWFTPEEVASGALKVLYRSNRTVWVPSFTNKLQVFAVKHLPARFVIRTWMRQQKG